MRSSMRCSLRHTAAAVSMLLVTWSCQSGGEAPPPSTPAESDASPAAGGEGATPGDAGATPPAAEPAAAPDPDAAPGNAAEAPPATDSATPTAASVTCKDGDKIRQVGETWEVKCNTCRCTDTGQMACTLKHCDE